MQTKQDLNGRQFRIVHAEPSIEHPGLMLMLVHEIDADGKMIGDLRILPVEPIES